MDSLEELFQKCQTVSGARHRIISGKRIDNMAYQIALPETQNQIKEEIWQSTHRTSLESLDQKLEEIHLKYESETHPIKKQIWFLKYELEIESYYEPEVGLDDQDLAEIQKIKVSIEELEKALESRKPNGS